MNEESAMMRAGFKKPAPKGLFQGKSLQRKLYDRFI